MPKAQSRNPKVMSPFEAFDPANKTTMRIGTWNRLPPFVAVRKMRNISPRDHAGVATSCAPNTPKIDDASRNGLRVGFRGCRLQETSTSLVEAIWLVFCGPLCRWTRSCSSCPSSRVQNPSLGHHFCCKAFESVPKCSPIPFEKRHQTWQGSGCLSYTVKWSDFHHCSR